MGDRFKVIFSGQLRAGADLNEVVIRFCETFKLPEAKARALLSTRKWVTLKKDLPEEKARRYQQVLEKLGMVATLEPMSPPAQPSPDTLDLTLVPIEEKWEKVHACPNCGSERIEDGSCLECGIIIEKYLEVYGNVPGMVRSARPVASQWGSVTEGEDTAPDGGTGKR